MPFKLQAPIVFTSQEKLDLLRQVPRCAVGNTTKNTWIAEVIRFVKHGVSTHTFGYEGKGCSQTIEALQGELARGSLKWHLSNRSKTVIYAYDGATIQMEEKLLARWQAELDKHPGYDWRGIANHASGYVLGNDRDKWFCNEFMVTTILEEWGIRIIDKRLPIQKSAPRDIDRWMLKTGLKEGWRIVFMHNITMEEFQRETFERMPLEMVWDEVSKLWTMERKDA